MTHDDARAREVAAVNNWTPDRPTKPGKYWLSLPQHLRAELDRMVGHKTDACFIANIYGENIESPLINGDLDSVRVQDWLEGAQWMPFVGPYVEPPDPFAKPVPSLRERVEALERYGAWTPDSGGAVVLAEKEGAYLLRSEVLVLLDEVTR